ncbi:MAG: RagB/SusD family nutrient uptake outer membrane protein [Gemmatimonadetes bacterium]|nr:RagB/SusD family nutrient uptake outer membrane protein [Gemmatimonadota bacterium]
MTRVHRFGGVLALAAAALGTAACTDLTEVPFDQITEENFNPSEGDIGSLLAPAYTPLRDVWMGWYGNIDFQEETADALLTPVRPNGWYDGGTYVRLHEHRWTSTSNGQPSALWGRSYNGITAANRVIHQIESGVAPVADEDLRTRILAELRALRAYYYFLVMDGFGNIPIVTDFTDTDLPEQSTRQEAFDFIVSELTTVLPNLSADGPGESTYGRINQWAARALLGRLYLNAEVYTGTPMYDDVLSVTDPIVSSGLYSLDPDYLGPFRRNNDGSTEILWAVPYDAINGCCSMFHMKTLKPELRFVFNFPAQPWGGSASNPQFVATYDEDDTRFKGTPEEDGRGGTWLVGPQFTPDGDFGYEFIRHVPHINPPAELRAFNTGYPVWKYEVYPGMQWTSDVDYPIIRYAEVLMMRAEALLRTGDAAGAAALVTQVRQRAFAETDPAEAVVTPADLTSGSSYLYGWYDYDGVVKTGPDGTAVSNDTGGPYGGADIQYGRFLDELGWEFAVEGHRRRDLIRFGVFTTKMWFNHAPNGDHRILFAIPNFAMETNPNLTQNPGY